MKKIIKNFLNHTFKISSYPSGAKVTYIVDAYDRSKDIVCTTPCKMTLPWEPIRKKPSKKRILIEKDGYKPKVVKLSITKIMIKLIVITFILSFIGSFFINLFNLKISICQFLIIYLIVFLNISVGSDDLNITLEREDNK